MQSPTPIRGRLQLIALGAATLVIVGTLGTPQGLYSDPAQQLRATQQYVRGESPTINTHVDAFADDLTRDHARWLSWWAPGTPLAAYPLLAAGLPIGVALRIIFAVCLLAGSIGWARWVSLFELPAWLAMTTSAAIPLLRYSTHTLFFFSAEAYAYLLVPWCLLAAYALARSWQGSRPGLGLVAAAGVGLLLGGTFVMKYALVLATVGALSYLALVALSLNPSLLARWAFGRWLTGLPDAGNGSDAHSGPAPRLVARAQFAVAAVAFAVPVVALSVINRLASDAANLVTSSAGLRLDPLIPLYAIANPALAMADADGLLAYLLLHPVHGITDSKAILLPFGLPAGILLLWIVARRSAFRGPGLLALCVAASSVASLLVIWTISSGVSYEARHVVGASMALLPLALREGLALGTGARRQVRLALAAAAAAYLAVPAAYGVVALVGKVARLPEDYRTGGTRLYTPLLASHDLEGCRTRLLSEFQPERDVWYHTEPMSALDLPGRAIVTHADFEEMPQIEGARYLTSAPRRVHALLPTHFEGNGKGAAIRRSFPQAIRWDSARVDGCEYTRWMAELRPQLTPDSLLPQDGR